MRVLGAKFPVYVMVTKCDLIQGAVKFCDNLEDPVLQQAMGRLNQSPVCGHETFYRSDDAVHGRSAQGVTPADFQPGWGQKKPIRP
jgi:hypothetical protein